ncbi:MAG: DUF433 domain-containing protein [Phycisphaerales bacterium]
MNEAWTTRITQDPAVMAGRPCIRGMRVTVGALLAQLAAGRSHEQVLEEFPYLERADILAALAFAAWRVDEQDESLAKRAAS